MTTKGLWGHGPFHGGLMVVGYGVQEYGGVIERPVDNDDRMARPKDHCVPAFNGFLALQRQIITLEFLVRVIKALIEGPDKSSKTSEKATEPAMPSLRLAMVTLMSGVGTPSLAELAGTCRHYHTTRDDYLLALLQDSTFLTHQVGHLLSSRPELVPDEKGRRDRAASDRHIGAAFLDASHNAIKTVSVWRYMTHLMEVLVHLDSIPSHPKADQSVVREISNVCQLEYKRAQSLLRRHFQTGTGKRLFQRTSNSYDKAGNARVKVRRNAKDLTKGDTQVEYLLCLCQPETTASDAADCMRKLSELYRLEPAKREELEEGEAEALFDVGMILGFIQELTCVIQLPPPPNKHGQGFTSKWQEAEVKVNQVKRKVDLRDMGVSMGNYSEPNIVDRIVRFIDNFFEENAGEDLGRTYRRLNREGIEGLLGGLGKLPDYENPGDSRDDTRLRTMTISQSSGSQPEPSNLPPLSRLHITSTGPVDADVEAADSIPSHEETGKSCVADSIRRLFRSPQEEVSEDWSLFEQAMVDVGFISEPKFGSIYTFMLPEPGAQATSVTVQRPQKSRIQGHLVPLFTWPLKKLYGWDAETDFAKMVDVANATEAAIMSEARRNFGVPDESDPLEYE